MNPNAIITGASRGLGEHLTAKLWAAGYDLFITARDHDRLAEVCSSLEPRPSQSVIGHCADLSHPDSIKGLVTAFKQRFTRLDVLINNAAIQGPIGQFWNNDFEQWVDAMQVDLMSPVALCQALIPLMIDQKRGSIINISGGGATTPRPNFSAYATAKAGLVRFSETIAEELKQYHVKVNCIAPGPMKTAMLSEVLQVGSQVAGTREYAAAQSVFADSDPTFDRVAQLVLFLSGDQSNGLTGKLISAIWDNWEKWPEQLNALSSTDVYTLRRISGRDRGMPWADH